MENILHLDPTSEVELRVSSREKEIEAIRAVSLASGACMGWPPQEGLGLAYWKLQQDLSRVEVNCSSSISKLEDIQLVSTRLVPTAQDDLDIQISSNLVEKRTGDIQICSPLAKERLEDIQIEDYVSGVEDEVSGVEDEVSGVEDKVSGVKDDVSGVEDKVSGVEDNVSGVEDNVSGVEDNVSGVEDDVSCVEDEVGSGSGAPVVLEGWTMKRGEHFRNWRQRYFMLKSDGQLLGYKTRPVNVTELSLPSNKFTVRDCQVMCTEEPRPNCLLLRGLYLDSVVERLFSLEDSGQRELWYQAILKVRNALRSKEEKKVCLEDFQILKVLGRGAFGKVVMCREKSSNTILAMKILKKTLLLEKQEVEHTKTENRVLQSLRHPFLVNLKYSFTTSDRVFFVMEYVGGGELFEHIGRLGRFPEEWVAFYGAEITLALGYLHSRGIIYRDLKLENLILDIQGHVKIVDFGLCKDDIFGGSLARTMCGTPAYMAPEVFVKREYGRAVDWWSLGVVIYEMATGELPFYSDIREEMFKLICKEKLRFPRSNDLSECLKSLITALLKKDARKRLGFNDDGAMEVMSASFFKGIPWNLLERRKLTPPFKPQVLDETDNPYISPEFLDQSTELTPTNTNLDSATFSDFSFKKGSWNYGRSSSTVSRDMEISI